ncbi:MAG: glycosyltransferase family 2 protein, partial [Lachnospiraceae bacterium]|nr:glycosyltransferase family 2 protein [Lachnospiraceae bacterium]
MSRKLHFVRYKELVGCLTKPVKSRLFCQTCTKKNREINVLFSIIIPVYNTEKYLGSCLDSIAAQAFDDFEVILVDDGSTDSSGRMCDEFCENFNTRAGRKNRARVIHQENRGASAARNRGIKEASGEWIWFVDSDDYIHFDALNTINERMRFAKGDLYAFQYIKVDEDGKEPEYIFFRENQERFRFNNEGNLIWNYIDRLF